MSGKKWWLALLCGAFLALPGAAQDNAGKDEIPAQAPPEAEKKDEPPAQETASRKKDVEDPPLHRWGGFTISLAAWTPSSIGAQDEVAIANPTSGAPYPLLVGSDASLRESWLAAYHLPKGMGSLVLHYDSMNLDAQADFLSPGRFIYGENQAFPAYRGAFDDGLSDGVSMDSRHKTRETRLEFSNTAWDTKHTHATWGAGVRNVDYSQLLNITYLAIVPNLPPLIPPVIDPQPPPETYAPRPDVVIEQSDFSGTGAGASLDVEFRLHPRLSIISGLSIGVLRGRVSTYYESVTSFYYTTRPTYHILTKDELFDILNTGSKDDIVAVSQDSVTNALYVKEVPQAAQTFDLYVGLESRVWRGLKVFATFRELYYQNVGTRNIPMPDLSIESESLSVGYEGYLVGLSWRF